MVPNFCIRGLAVAGMAALLAGCGGSSTPSPASPATDAKLLPRTPADIVPCKFSITSNFNGTAIPGGRTIWFSAVAKVKGVGAPPVTIYVTNAIVSFTANSVPYSIALPNSAVTLDPNATSATILYDPNRGWQETAPPALNGNILIDAGQYAVTSDLPAGIKNVTLSGNFNASLSGVSLDWAWSAATYSQFNRDNALVGVKPVDSNTASQYKNSDRAGAPENEKPYVAGGAMGGGGSNYTGGLSGTSSASLCVGTPTPAPTASPSPGPLAEYVYTTNVTANNISGYSVNASTGALTPVTGSPIGSGVGYGLAVDASGKFLYADGYADTAVFGYTIDPSSGALSAIAGSPFTGGSDSNFFAASPNGKFLYDESTGSDNIVGYSIDASSGALTTLPGSPYTYSGLPNGIVIAPSGHYAYVVDGFSGSVTAYSIGVNGALTLLASPVGGPGYGTGVPVVDPTGRFLYDVTVYQNEISGYSIDQTTGALTPLTGSPFSAGTHPVYIDIDPTGKFAYATTSDGVDEFTIDSTTGALAQTDSVAAGSGADGVKVDPAGKFLYVGNQADGTVSAYSIDPSNGRLTPVTGSPFAAGAGTTNIVVTPI